MENKIKSVYNAPETEAIEVCTKSSLLNMSGGKYDSWENEDI